MTFFDRPFPRASGAVAGDERESADWVRALGSPGADRDAAVDRLYGLLLLAARDEIRRRSGQLRIAGPEADDLAHQSAGDALMAISQKIGQFRGESRFTTWAYKFVMLEVSTKIGRHFWRDRGPALDTEEWARLPDRIGLGPSQELEWRDLVAALRRAIDDGLTAHQRRIFVAVVLDEVPMDALAVQLGSNRNAIYKTLFDARRTLRAHLVSAGYLPPENAARA